MHSCLRRRSIGKVAVVKLSLLFCLLPVASGSRWNLLFYIAADNDLDCYALRDISVLVAAMNGLGSEGCIWSQCMSVNDTCGEEMIRRDARSCVSDSLKVDLQCCREEKYPKARTNSPSEHMRNSRQEKICSRCMLQFHNSFWPNFLHR